MSDEIMDYPRHDDIYVTNGLLKTEIDRLREENAELVAAMARKVEEMIDSSTASDEYNRGYETALSGLKPELERLRAENAEQDKRILEWGDKYADLSNEADRLRAEKVEMREAMEDLLNLEQGCHERADAILARTAKG